MASWGEGDAWPRPHHLMGQQHRKPAHVMSKPANALRAAVAGRDRVVTGTGDERKEF